VVVVAAGNTGPGAKSVNCPGDAPDAITVGATDRNDTIASFSSRGPTDDGRVKPDVTCMGVGLVAARASGTSKGSPIDQYYTSMSGTSMATPMVSGVVALMLQKNSSLTPVEIKSILIGTAKPLGGSTPNNNYGWGRVQAKYAVDNVTISASTSPKYPRTVWSDPGNTGSVVGRVVSSANLSAGIARAYVAIVNASNVSQEYCHVISDAYGNYNITGVNATYSSALGQGPNGQTGSDYILGNSMYKMYAYKSVNGSGYSAAFGIDANQSGAVTTSIVMFTKPARIDLIAERPNLISNGTDSIKITAYMYDALGNPVSDGYNINFTIGNSTKNSFMGGGFPWIPGNGSLNSIGNNVSINNPTLFNQGQANVQFGWVDAEYSGNSSTVWAYSADNANVNASIKINLGQEQYTYNLVSGWNLISVPLNITDNDIGDFFPDDVKSGIIDVWGWNETAQDFMFYSLNKNDWYYTQYEPLNMIEPSKAYWVEMNKTASFTIYGTMLSDSPTGSSTLVKGWNFHGITGFASYPVESLYSNPIDVWGWNETAQDFMFYSLNKNDWYYTQYGPLNTINSGHGYWIEMP
jgi:hypothetical protein